MRTEYILIFLSFLTPFIQLILLFILKFFPSKIHFHTSRFRISVIFIWIIFLLTIIHLGISNPILILSNFLFIFSLNLFVYTFWSLITHGFTINILINLTKDKNGVSLNKWIYKYTNGNDLNYFTNNRLKILIRLLFVKKKNNQIIITNLGIVVNKIIYIFKYLMLIR
tara:strand:+ start:285 stop:788 length:504 start_codon:yes stop_codon:yes gene_type:complete